MSTEAEKPVTYSEREAREGEQDRELVLSALADGEVWIFIYADQGKAIAGELDIKIECGGLVDPETTKILLSKIVAKLP